MTGFYPEQVEGLPHPFAPRKIGPPVPSLMEGTINTAKQDVEKLLNKVPDDCSVEDIQYHLYVLDKVRRGLEDARMNGAMTQEEVETRLSKWLAE